MWDEDAWKKALDLGKRLLDYFPRVKVVKVEGDPDDHPRSALWRMVRDAPLLTPAGGLRARISRLASL